MNPMVEQLHIVRKITQSVADYLKRLFVLFQQGKGDRVVEAHYKTSVERQGNSVVSSRLLSIAM